MNYVIHTLSSDEISIFSLRINKFCYIKNCRHRLNFRLFLKIFRSLKIFLIHLVIILMMSAKMAIPGLLKITVFRNKGYKVIIRVDDVNNKILSPD